MTIRITLIVPPEPLVTTESGSSGIHPLATILATALTRHEHAHLVVHDRRKELFGMTKRG